MKCLRCGHEWQARVANPVRCPKCLSPYWNLPRRRVTGIVQADAIATNIERLRDIAAGEVDDAAPPMCNYTEFDSETGERYGCSLQEHSVKVAHQRGRKL
jgi:DNA-directed RNA polymerase subunit RPC12/RpoP